MQTAPRKRWVPPPLVIVAGVVVAAVLYLPNLGVRSAPTIRLVVTGPPGTVVNARVDFDGRIQESSDPLPAEYSGVAYKTAFSIMDAVRSDRVIRVALLANNVLQGTGTAVRGVDGEFDQNRPTKSCTFSAAWEFTEARTSEHGAEGVEAEFGPRDLLHLRPPEWTVSEWVNSDPLRLSDLRGRVVLVRWLASPNCPECSASAPALREFHANYFDLGLTVVGMHHNSIGATLERIQEDAREFGFDFPVAIDRRTKARNLWTHGNIGCRFTSATFLLDRQGTIRFIHPGGRYVRGDSTFEALEDAILRLLGEPEPGPAPDVTEARALPIDDGTPES